MFRLIILFNGIADVQTQHQGLDLLIYLFQLTAFLLFLFLSTSIIDILGSEVNLLRSGVRVLLALLFWASIVDL
jgi:hypothetical protein